jgi:hypothetical protein
MFTCDLHSMVLYKSTTAFYYHNSFLLSMIPEDILNVDLTSKYFAGKNISIVIMMEKLYC